MSPSFPTLRRAAASLAALAAVVALTLAPGASPAWAADGVQDLQVEARLKADGLLHVTETLTFAGQPPAEVVQRLANGREALGKADYVYTYTDVAAKADGKDVAASVAQEDSHTVVKVAPQGAASVTISYTVRGTTHREAGERARYTYRLLQGLSLPVEKFTATVVPPGAFEDITCRSGAPDAPRACTSFQAGTHQQPVPTFEDGPLGAGAIVETSLGFAPRVVAPTEEIRERWSLDRAFSLRPLPILAALGTLLLGGAALWALHRRGGQDRAFAHPTTIAEFHPVAEGQSEFRLKADVRPGQVGTLLDERVDPIDVTASLLDLAVRGHLRIHELPRTDARAPLDWELERRSGTDPLRPFEERLLDAVAPTHGGRLRVSQLGGAVGGAVQGIQDALYDDMVAKGWYAARPDRTRGGWGTAGVAAVVAAIVALGLLAAFTSFGWVGLVLLVLAVALVLVGREMPSRTEHGASVLAGLLALRHTLQTQPTDQMPRGREYAELSEVLPYAIVLGGQERWLEALVAHDDDAAGDGQDLSWYHASEDWRMQDMPACLDAFVTTVTGRLFRRA